MSDISLSFDDVYGLIADLTEMPKVITEKAEQAVQQAAIRTKKKWAADALKSLPASVAKQYAPTIDYEVREFGAFGQTQFTAEVGPDLARYGGKTGKGGLIPSLGILDDPEGTSSILTPPSRLRPKAEKFAEGELVKGLEIAIAQSMKAAGL